MFPRLTAAALLAATLQGPPPAPPAAWQRVIGEYGNDSTTHLMILEKDGALVARFDSTHEQRLTPNGPNRFLLDGSVLRFRIDAKGRVIALALHDSLWRRRAIGPEAGNVFRIVPLKPVEELRKEALAASPPPETGEFKSADLVELVKLDSTIKLDIRYATTRNFMGTPLYTQARAFMQRPAAEALVRAHHELEKLGYGLLIHDGYRPWYVTKMFWDATTPENHGFVANPATGSRHNRGCAVDLSLYDLRTGKPIEMPGTYDEFSQRSFPTYPGGTTRQRWHRELLRSAMEAQGFSVNPSEWWHFDYKDWKSYRIGNTPFEQLGH
jgi:D-alanyl-D-alanine dipeptidase